MCRAEQLLRQENARKPTAETRNGSEAIQYPQVVGNMIPYALWLHGTLELVRGSGTAAGRRNGLINSGVAKAATAKTKWSTCINKWECSCHSCRIRTLPPVNERGH